MEIPATVTSKGQITIPIEVRKALGLAAGSRVVFRMVDGSTVIQAENATETAPRVELIRVPDFFALAGTVPVPPDVDSNDWRAQRDAAWEAEVRNRL